ncbi:MAG: family efflux transporter [Clostridia bacterium]|jgi:putative MATE family efflux protein|nr:family efflux transporter [Clostridia bacterium]
MERLDKRNLILKGNLYKVIITLALPIMLNNFIQTLFNLADAYYIGQLGYIEFAATSFVWPVNFLFISIGIGISIAGTSILSQYVGAEKYEEANKVSSQLITLTCIISVIFAAVGYFTAPYIVRLMQASGELARFGSIYLQITFLDTPFMFFYFAFNSIMNAQGDTIKPTILSGLCALLNIILDPIFIFTLNMGVAGAAIATLISKAALAILGAIILAKYSSIIRPSIKNFKFDKEIIKQLFKIGLPSIIGQSGSSLGFLVLNSFILSYGSITLAAFGMVNRITSLVMQPAMGIGSAMTAIVGQNLGNSQPERVKEAFRKSMSLSLFISITGIILLLAFDREIIKFFIEAEDNPEVISQGITYLKYIAYSMPLMGIFSIFQGVFQGSGHTKYSMAMEIGRLWVVRIPMILIFKYLTTAGETGIWFSMSFSNLLVCLYGYWLYRRNKWQARIIG